MPLNTAAAERLKVSLALYRALKRMEDKGQTRSTNGLRAELYAELRAMLDAVDADAE